MINQVFRFRSPLLTGLISVPVVAFGIGFSSAASAAQLPSSDTVPVAAHAPSVQPALMLAHSGHGRQHMQNHSKQGRGGTHEKAGRYQRHHRMMAMFHGLDLSEEQRDKLFALRHAGAPMMRSLAKERRAARKELRELTRAEQFNQASVDAVAARAGQTASTMAAMRAKLMFDMRAVLTPEQRADLDRRRTAGKHGMRGKHGGSNGCGKR